MTRPVRRATRVALRDPAFAAVAGLAWLLLIAARGAITVFHLRRISAWLGAGMQETPVHGLTPGQLRWARRVARVIRETAPHTPTNSNCYPQALAAHVLLRARRIPSTFYYGAAFRDGEPSLETHVWVRAGPLIVTGAPVHRSFAVVSTFACGQGETTPFTPQRVPAGS